MIEFMPSALKALKLRDYVVRFAFGGACSVLAGLVATRYGAAVGGLFLAFPAIFPAGASLIENQEREKKQRLGSDGTIRGRMAAGSDAAGAAMGCVGLAVFGLLVWKLLPRFNTAWSISIACMGWTFFTLLLWEFRKRRLFGRRQRA